MPETVSQEERAGSFLGARLPKRLVLLPPDGPSPQAACMRPGPGGRGRAGDRVWHQPGQGNRGRAGVTRKK